jgi:hypothetical protein
MTSKELEEHLIAKEMDIVAAQKRRDFSAVEALLADGFHEIGSSGRLFSKSEILDAIQEVQIIDCSFDSFKILPIDKECVIVTYVATAKRSHKGHEHWNRAYRSSIWMEREGSWRVVFHQATPLPPVL